MDASTHTLNTNILGVTPYFFELIKSLQMSINDLERALINIESLKAEAIDYAGKPKHDIAIYGIEIQKGLADRYYAFIVQQAQSLPSKLYYANNSLFNPVDVEVEKIYGINYFEYPEYDSAFIAQAKYKGRQLSDSQMDLLEKDGYDFRSKITLE
jgi:hypothetical protein